jgi:antitoxin MazE
MVKKRTEIVELKIVPIGNSKGVRLPKEILERYAIGESIVLEAREEGLVFRNEKDKRLSWADTYKDMAREREDWRDIEEATIADGLDPDEKW